MVTQSHPNPVTLLLTRPMAQAAGFAKTLSARFGDRLRILRTPLTAPRFFSPSLPEGPFEALILTSQTGIAAYARLIGETHGLPGDVFCVGEQTARMARQAGLNPVLVARDAAGLKEQIKAIRPKGKLLHLRGRDVRGDVAETLNSAAVDTVEAVLYAQEPLALTTEAIQALHQPDPVLVPLFSPRAAVIFAAEVARVCGISPLFVASMSAEVALAARGLDAQIRVAETPDAGAMSDSLALLLDDVQRA